MLDADRLELFDGETDLLGSTVLGGVGDPRQAVVASSRIDRTEIIGRPIVGGSTHPDRHQVVGAVSEHLVHRGRAGVSREVR